MTLWNSCRFDEVSKSTYALEVYIDNDDVVSVSVGENVTYDISVNPNLPSNVLRVRHCKSHCLLDQILCNVRVGPSSPVTGASLLLFYHQFIDVTLLGC